MRSDVSLNISPSDQSDGTYRVDADDHVPPAEIIYSYKSKYRL